MAAKHTLLFTFLIGLFLFGGCVQKQEKLEPPINYTINDEYQYYPFASSPYEIDQKIKGALEWYVVVDKNATDDQVKALMCYFDATRTELLRQTGAANINILIYKDPQYANKATYDKYLYEDVPIRQLIIESPIASYNYNPKLAQTTTPKTRFFFFGVDPEAFPIEVELDCASTD